MPIRTTVTPLMLSVTSKLIVLLWLLVPIIALVILLVITRLLLPLVAQIMVPFWLILANLIPLIKLLVKEPPLNLLVVLSLLLNRPVLM